MTGIQIFKQAIKFPRITRVESEAARTLIIEKMSQSKVDSLNASKSSSWNRCKSLFCDSIVASHCKREKQSVFENMEMKNEGGVEKHRI